MQRRDLEKPESDHPPPGGGSHSDRGRDASRGVSLAYPLAPAPEPPDLPGSVTLRRSSDEVIDAVAADLVAHAINCVRQFGDFHLAVSGDPALEPLYLRLMYDPAHRALPWRRTHLWLTHERRVEFTNDHSVFGQIRETIVDHSDIPPEQTHPIFPLADDADKRYERELRETLLWREKGHDRLDFTLLALRDDGGLAGMAPNEAQSREPGRFVRDVGQDAGEWLSSQPSEAVAMTLQLLNGARFIAVVATGQARRDAVARLADKRQGGRDLPAASLAPLQGMLRWYLDDSARPR